MDTVDVRKFSRHLINCAGNKRLSTPLKIEIALTNKCNSRCAHCSNYSKLRNISKFFSVDFLDDIISCNPLEIILTGGEPLLHPDFVDIVKRIKKNKIFVTILSNGSLIDTQIIERIKEAGFTDGDVFQISCDAPDKQTYTLQRGVDLFEATIEGIKRLQEAGLCTELHVVPTKINIDKISDIVKLAETLKCNYISGGPYAPFGQQIENLECPSEQLFDVNKMIENQVKNYQIKYLGGIEGERCSNKKILVDLAENKKIKERQRKCLCAAGRNSCYIDENADVYPCVYLMAAYSKLGNLNYNSLLEIWNSEKLSEYRNGLSLKTTKCENCLFWNQCGGGCLGVSSYTQGKLVPGFDPRCYLNGEQ